MGDGQVRFRPVPTSGLDRYARRAVQRAIWRGSPLPVGLERVGRAQSMRLLERRWAPAFYLGWGALELAWSAAGDAGANRTFRTLFGLFLVCGGLATWRQLRGARRIIAAPDGAAGNQNRPAGTGQRPN